MHRGALLEHIKLSYIYILFEEIFKCSSSNLSPALSSFLAESLFCLKKTLKKVIPLHPQIATMKKFFCCHKGESSSGAVEAEEQTQPLQPVQLQPSSSQPVQDPQASSRSVKDENEAIFDENLFDNNEGLNLAWRNLWKSYEDAKGSFLVSPPWNTLFLGLLLRFESQQALTCVARLI